MSLKVGVILGIIALAVCFAAVPLLAANLGGWYAYWGAMLVSVVWAAILYWLKVTHYWEGEN